MLSDDFDQRLAAARQRISAELHVHRVVRNAVERGVISMWTTLGKFAGWLRRHITEVEFLLTLVIGGFTIIGVWIAQEANRKADAAIKLSADQAALAETQAALAWQTFDMERRLSAYEMLAIKGPGRNGKDFALQTLLEVGDLRGLDIGCEEMQISTNTLGTCDGVDLSGIELGAGRRREISISNFDGVNFYRAGFEGIEFQEVNFVGADLEWATFFESELWMVSLAKSRLWNTSFEKGKFDDVDLSGASIDGLRFTDVDFGGWYNLSGAYNPGGADLALPQEIVESGFYWAGDPPIGLKAELVECPIPAEGVQKPPGALPIGCGPPNKVWVGDIVFDLSPKS